MSTRSFDDLGLSEALLGSVAAQGYDTPTEIQARAIPPLLEGKDLLGTAQTGTGKTAAFTLPLLQRLVADGHADRGRSNGGGGARRSDGAPQGGATDRAAAARRLADRSRSSLHRRASSPSR